MLTSILSHTLPPWLSHCGPQNDVVISTRVRLARNLSHHQFPQHASPYERSLVFTEIQDAFKTAGACRSFNVVNFESLDACECQFLVEERLASHELADYKGERGIVYDPGRRISVMVNEDDHLRMQCVDSGLRAEELWKDLDGIDDALAMNLNFAFDERRGFLTSFPLHAGCGLSVSVLMHLPALVLSRTIDPVLQGAMQSGFALKGFFKYAATSAGSMFLLHYNAFMGSKESQFCHNADTLLHAIVDQEHKARERLLSEARLELVDKIYRSYGILSHAALLTVDEFLNLSSGLRLGIECNLFDKCTIDDLNRLMLFVLPAHCATATKTDMNEELLRSKRADLVKAFFAR